MMSLFGDLAPAVPISKKESKAAERKRKQKLCYSLTSERWKAAVHSFAVDLFLPNVDTFIIQSLTESYERSAKKQGWPLTVERRAMAGITSRLLKEGLISQIDGLLDRRDQGNWTQVYRSNLYGRSHMPGQSEF